MLLEQSCTSPGNWMIEGYTVRRSKTNGRVRWWIAKDGLHIALAQTLGDARDRIRQEVNR